MASARLVGVVCTDCGKRFANRWAYNQHRTNRYSEGQIAILCSASNPKWLQSEDETSPPLFSSLQEHCDQAGGNRMQNIFHVLTVSYFHHTFTISQICVSAWINCTNFTKLSWFSWLHCFFEVDLFWFHWFPSIILIVEKTGWIR